MGRLWVDCLAVEEELDHLMVVENLGHDQQGPWTVGEVERLVVCHISASLVSCAWHAAKRPSCVHLEARTSLRVRACAVVGREHIRQGLDSFSEKRVYWKDTWARMALLTMREQQHTEQQQGLGTGKGRPASTIWTWNYRPYRFSTAIPEPAAHGRQERQWKVRLIRVVASEEASHNLLPLQRAGLGPGRDRNQVVEERLEAAWVCLTKARGLWTRTGVASGSKEG